MMTDCNRWLASVVALVLMANTVDAYAFVAPHSLKSRTFQAPSAVLRSPSSKRSTSKLQMLDDTLIQGAGIAIAGLAVGVGLVAFTENQGERAKERGSGLSESMSSRITGQLMEDVEVSSVSDLGSLTAQLEAALKETGADETKDIAKEPTEEELKKRAEEADDGW